MAKIRRFFLTETTPMSRIRENRIDLVRGLSLLLIFVDHANVSFSEALQQSRGFSDAAELFVMMAGMSAALAYHPATGRPDLWSVARRTLRRSLELYRVHLMLFAGLVTALVLLPLPHHETILAYWSLDLIAAEPLRYAGEALLLRYLPAELDILPLYIVLIAAIPLFFVVIDRSLRLALAASATLWLAAGLLHLNVTDLASRKDVWYFGPFSWQLVFVIGLVAGLRVRRGQPAFPYVRPLFLAALAFSLLAVPANLFVHFTGLKDQPVLHLLLSKTSEGPLRLINALAIVYVVFNLDALKRLSPEGWLRPVFAAGRNSLPIFVLGAILSDTITVLVIGTGGLPLWLDLSVIAVGVALQLAFSLYRDRARRGPFGQPQRSLMVASEADHDYGYRKDTGTPAMDDAARKPAT